MAAVNEEKKSLHRVKRQHFSFSNYSTCNAEIDSRTWANFPVNGKLLERGGFSGQLNVDEENGRVADAKTIRLNASFLHGRRWPPGGFFRMAGSKNRSTAPFSVPLLSINDGPKATAGSRG
jgi:hypothetical protein